MDKKGKPTEGEYEILQLLWQEGPSSVKHLHNMLSAKKDVVYTTTLKLMQNLHEKGLVSREKKGRQHIYLAKASKSDTQSHFLASFIQRFFQGSVPDMVMQALGHQKPSPEELEQIEKYINQLKKGGEK
ncbi:MAG: BlaI/MecI/CopY family transcriptional regulator [Candidatus Cyclobacteriaceae bacterium M3_2C_046]